MGSKKDNRKKKQRQGVEIGPFVRQTVKGTYRSPSFHAIIGLSVGMVGGPYGRRDPSYTVPLVILINNARVLFRKNTVRGNERGLIPEFEKKLNFCKVIF